QAEDGIRDATVTGVQTCALPIFRSNSPARWGSAVAALVLLGAAQLVSISPMVGLPTRPCRCCDRSGTRFAFDAGRRLPKRRSPRSEERRVGKDCRCLSVP